MVSSNLQHKGTDNERYRGMARDCGGDCERCDFPWYRVCVCFPTYRYGAHMRDEWQADLDTLSIIALILLMMAGAALGMLGFFVYIAFNLI